MTQNTPRLRTIPLIFFPEITCQFKLHLSKCSLQSEKKSYRRDKRPSVTLVNTTDMSLKRRCSTPSTAYMKTGLTGRNSASQTQWRVNSPPGQKNWSPLSDFNQKMSFLQTKCFTFAQLSFPRLVFPPFKLVVSEFHPPPSAFQQTENQTDTSLVGYLPNLAIFRWLV